MSIRSIKWWQWMVVAVVVGLTLALVRRGPAGDLQLQYGESLNDQAKFEAALVDMMQTQTGQRPRVFRDVSVHPFEIDDGPAGKRPVHVVSGTYFNGRPDAAG